MNSKNSSCAYLTKDCHNCYNTLFNKNEEKKYLNKVKNLLGELEYLFLEKNKCTKRLTNLKNDKKEIINLKEKNLERFTTRLNKLLQKKLTLENTVKDERSIR